MGQQEQYHAALPGKGLRRNQFLRPFENGGPGKFKGLVERGCHDNSQKNFVATRKQAFAKLLAEFGTGCHNRSLSSQTILWAEFQ